MPFDFDKFRRRVDGQEGDAGAFPSHFDPAAILDIMTRQHGEQKAASEGFDGRGRVMPSDDPNEQALALRTRGTVPTMWGQIMQRRHGGIQGRGVAGALGYSINPAAGSPALQEFQNNALANRYPSSAFGLLKRQYGR